MRPINGLSALTLILALLIAACSRAGAGDDGTTADPSSKEYAPFTSEPETSEILVPPPPGARYQAEASALENESPGGGPSMYGSSGRFEADRSVIHVYVTDEPLEEVARYYLELREETPHYVDVEEMVDWDQGPETLNIEEEPAAPLPPDAMEATVQQYREQGYMDEDEAREMLAHMDIYREMYPKLQNVVLSTVVFDIEEAPENDDPESRTEYRYVEVEITRPYVDEANREVRDQTEITYIVHHMKLQGS
jgi:hypothetical protein